MLNWFNFNSLAAKQPVSVMRIFVVALAPLVHFNSIRIDRLRWKCYNYQSTAAELLRMMPAAAAGSANVHVAYVRPCLCVSNDSINQPLCYLRAATIIRFKSNRMKLKSRFPFLFFSASFARAHNFLCWFRMIIIIVIIYVPVLDGRSDFRIFIFWMKFVVALWLNSYPPVCEQIQCDAIGRDLFWPENGEHAAAWHTFAYFLAAIAQFFLLLSQFHTFPSALA